MFFNKTIFSGLIFVNMGQFTYKFTYLVMLVCSLVCGLVKGICRGSVAPE